MKLPGLLILSLVIPFSVLANHHVKVSIRKNQFWEYASLQSEIDTYHAHFDIWLKEDGSSFHNVNKGSYQLIIRSVFGHKVCRHIVINKDVIIKTDLTVYYRLDESKSSFIERMEVGDTLYFYEVEGAFFSTRHQYFRVVKMDSLGLAWEYRERDSIAMLDSGWANKAIKDESTARLNHGFVPGNSSVYTKTYIEFDKQVYSYASHHPVRHRPFSRAWFFCRKMKKRRREIRSKFGPA